MPAPAPASPYPAFTIFVLKASAWAACGLSALATVAKAVSWASGFEAVTLPGIGEVALYKLVLGGAAAVGVLGVALLADLCWALFRAPGRAVKAVGALVGLLWIGLIAADWKISALGLEDAILAVDDEGPGPLRRDLREVQRRLEDDIRDIEILTHPDLAAQDEAVRAKARRDVQRLFGLEADADWGPATEAKVSARLKELERIPSDEARVDELRDQIAAAEREVAPSDAPEIIAGLVSVYVCLVLFGCAMLPSPKRARRPKRRKAAAQRAQRQRVKAHQRSNAPNGVRAHTKRRRGAAGIEAAASRDRSGLLGFFVRGR